MPSITPPAKVLVTGASGYIALWVVRQLLRAGYNVRGTVRSAEKGEAIKVLMEELEDHDAATRFEYIIIRDIAEVSPYRRRYCPIDLIYEYPRRQTHLMKP